MEMMLDKKKIQMTFLLELKMGCKAVETTWNINNAFGPGTANKCTVQWWLKKFCKEDKSLEMTSVLASHQKGTITNWELSSKLILLQLH